MLKIFKILRSGFGLQIVWLPKKKSVGKETRRLRNIE